MGKIFIAFHCHSVMSEKGNILVFTIIFMLLGSLLIVPLLSFMGTGLKTGALYNAKSKALYAADAGIEDGRWQIKYDRLNGTFSTYDPYDYSSAGWTYTLDNEKAINSKNVTVNIKNVWIPEITPIPDKATAKSIADSENLMVTGGAYDEGGVSKYKIVITFYPSVGDSLELSNIGVWLPPGFIYNGSCNLDDSGKTYHEFATPSISDCRGGQKVIWTLDSYPFAGDQISTIKKDALPGVKLLDSPMTAVITFAYTPSKAGARPEAVSWINFSGITSGQTYCWDAEVKVFGITSTAGSTSVETYITKTSVRKMGGAVNGDYFATGNSLMINADHDSSGIREQKQDSSATVGPPTLVTATPSPIYADNGIPEDANIANAYMYWASWYRLDSGRLVTLNSDDCSKFNSGGSPPATVYWDKDASSGWSVTTNGSRKYFSGIGNGSLEESTYRQLTQHGTYDLNLSSYYPANGWIFTLSWEQWFSGSAPGTNDGLDFALSNDGGATWSEWLPAFRGAGIGSSAFACTAIYQYNIPASYLTDNFKVKFFVVGFNSSGQACNIDNIKINALNPKTGITFKIDKGTGYQQVYFDSSGQPQTGSSELTAARTQALLTYTFNASDPPTLRGFAYTCNRDVTDLIINYAEQPSGTNTNFNGHGKYWVKGDLGDTGTSTTYYQQAHAGWSLVLVYSSPDTLGHQLFLYDTFIGSGYTSASAGVNVDFNRDGQPGGMISGFVVPDKIDGELNAAKLTCFVTEGDSVVGNDYLEIKGTAASSYEQLWDGTTTSGSGLINSKSSPTNVWNGQSVVLGSSDGVDIDTLGVDPAANPPQYITWDSNIFKPKDTNASINMVTHSDYWFLVYMILSFRSETTTGGALSYLIHG
jgi:hypothetical protein